MLRLALAAVFCACTSAPPAPPDPSRPQAAAVDAAVRRYYARLSARDWQALRSCFWDGATLATVWQPAGESAPRVFVTDIDEFCRRGPQGPGSQPIFEERVTAIELRLFENLAQAWARYEARFGNDEELLTWSGVDAITLMRFDGEWRITSISYTAAGGAP